MIAYFDCFSGISGDMTLGALVDAVVNPETLKAELSKLNVHGYEISIEKTERHRISATKVNVIESHHHNHNDEHYHHHHHRNLKDIVEIIDNSNLSDSIKSKTKAIFTRLATAEAKVHNTTIDEIHFHEVGAIDAIVDVVGSVIALELLEVDKIYSSPLTLGSGFTKCEHGVLPVPPPAVVELTKGIPVKSGSVQSELTTPTGSAIITTLAENFGNMPDMKIEKIGYGAGNKDFKEVPNLLRIFIGKENSQISILKSQIPNKKDNDSITDSVYVIETNIDNMNPEIYEYIIDKLFSLGALDVFLIPIIMKKSRPATLLSVITNEENFLQIANCVLSETTTIGLRYYTVNRIKLEREIKSIETKYGTVKVKVSKFFDGNVKISPEYEDCRRIAEEKGINIKEVYDSVRYEYCS